MEKTMSVQSQIDEMLNKLNKVRKFSGDSKKGSDLKFFRVPKDIGKTRVRFLETGMLIGSHFKLPEVSGKTNIFCFATYDMECPLCTLIEQYKSKVPEQLIDKINVVWQVNTNALVLETTGDDKPNPNEPVIFQLGDYQYRQILEQTKEEDMHDFLDWNTGSTVIFDRIAYAKKIDKKITSVRKAIGTEDEMEAIKEKMFDLKKIFRDPDDNYVQRMGSVVSAVKLQFRELTAALPQVNKVQAVSELDEFLDKELSPAPKAVATYSPEITEAKKKVSADPSKPPCFGDKTVYSLSNQQCIVCPYDFDCEESFSG